MKIPAIQANGNCKLSNATGIRRFITLFDPDIEVSPFEQRVVHFPIIMSRRRRHRDVTKRNIDNDFVYANRRIFAR